MAQIQREGRVSFGDASISIWEEYEGRGSEERAAWERKFRRQVFKRVIQQLNRLGWLVYEWDDAEQYRVIANNHRSCRKGDLHGLLDLSGRTLKFEMWQSVANITREDGNGKYEFDKESKMPYLLRLEMERTRRRLRDYLCNVFEGYEFSEGGTLRIQCGPGGLTAEEWVSMRIRETGHFNEALGHAAIHGGSDKSADGKTLHHGMKGVYTTDRKGRVITGTAYFDLNMNWWIVSGRYGLQISTNWEIWVDNPGELRQKRNERNRRGRLEAELSKAIQQMNFQRAEVIKRILFGDEPLFHLVSKKDGLYWRPNYSGYTSDRTDAGKYTAAEVEFYQGSRDVKVQPVYQAA